MNTLVRTAAVVAASGLAVLVQAACARSVTSDIEPDAPLVAPGAANPTPLTACIATSCPAPWATCRGGGLCATDTSRDAENCGGCGVSCPRQTGALHATSVCANGKCVFACEPLSADCNRAAGDGCEVFTGDDPNNCGGCGLACTAGELCWKGACGCPSGFTRCGSECKNLDSDNLSCGACDKKCVAPQNDDPEWKCGPGVQPQSTGWACESGGCKLACAPFFGDCDGSLCSNACETDTRTDRLNCGACGRACAANQDCVNGTCICPPGTTRCGGRCVDVDVDPDHCGACDNVCPGAGGDDANGTPTCKGGRCGYLCYAGFADCNGRTNDGCEVNVGSDPLHCGSCATRCDVARSQPCILGQCLTKPCEPERGTF